MNKTPEVSVVLPFSSSKDTLGKSIQSILNQSFIDFELLLINNNADEATRKTALDIATTDSRVNILEESRAGVVYAANKGMEYARGKYIARMDADDVSLHDRLKLQYEFLEERKDVCTVSGNIVYGGRSEKNKGFDHYVQWVNSIHSSKQISLNRFVEYPLVNPSIMFRKSLYEIYGGYRQGDFPEDYEYFLRIMDDDKPKVAKVSDDVLVWNDSPGRLSRIDTRYSIDAFYRIKTYYLSQWLRRNNPHYPNVWIWGAGRVSRKRSSMLKDHNIEIVGYIDVRKKTIDNKPCIHYEDIPKSGSRFIVSYVSNRGKRDEIRDFLNSRNYTEGKDYILA